MTRIIPNDTLGDGEVVYDGVCQCGHGFISRSDTRLCEWCSAGLPPGRVYRSYPADYPLPQPAKGHAATHIRREDNFTADPGDETGERP